MVSAFVPQILLELKKHDKSKIEVLTSYGDRLLAGLSSGDLRIYRISDVQSSEDTSDKPSPATELLREVEKFSRKPPQKLTGITKLNTLVSLSDGYVNLHDLQSFVLSERLEATKGATTFAVYSGAVQDASTSPAARQPRLAVSVKRKIILWSWHDTKFDLSPSEITLPAIAKLLIWVTDSKLVAGMDMGYVLIDVDTGFIKDINRPATSGETENVVGSRFGAVNSSSMGYMGMGSWIPKPLASRVGRNEILLAKDVNTLFVDFTGEAIEKRQIPWATAPEAVEYSHPYILALQPPTKGSLEVRNPQSLSLLQSVVIPGAAFLDVSPSTKSVPNASCRILLASDRRVWRLELQPYAAQSDELISQHKFDEALSLTGLIDEILLPDKNERLREIRILKGEELFVKQKYRDAMSLFIDTSAPAERVISKFPPSIAGHKNSDAVTESSQGDKNVSVVNEHFGKEQSKIEHKDHAPITRVLDDAVSARSADSDMQSIVPSVSGMRETDNMDGEALLKATKTLFSFLAHTRKQVQRFIDFDGELNETAHNEGSSDVPPYAYLLTSGNLAPIDSDWPQLLRELAVLVDTTLFRAYMHASPRLAGSLFRIDNFCAPDVVEEKLYASGNYIDLIDFLHGKKLHRQALELLEKLGRSSPESNVEDPLRGPGRLVAYLQQLPPQQIDLIFHFADWPLRADPQLAMKVFTADTSNAESLPRSKVLSFLEQRSPDLPMEYLEHVVEVFNDNSTEFHERLIDLYISKVTTDKSTGREDVALKLEKFLRQQHCYDADRVLRRMNDEEQLLYESRAILHSKLHQHLQALEIYVFKMHAPSKAESYCNAVYLANATIDTSLLDEDDSVYTMLFSMLLNPPAPQERNLEAALDLLSRHGTRIPPLSTLDFLPSDLSVEQLEGYLRGRMRAAASLAREQEIARVLAGVERSIVDIKLQVGDADDDLKSTTVFDGNQVNKGQNRRVVLSEDRMCLGCHKRFGRAAVRVWPSGEIRHYGCGEPQSARKDASGSSPSQRRARPVSARS